MKNALNNRPVLKSILPILLFALILFVLFVFVSRAQSVESEKQPEIVASGGTFILEKTVAAGGGNQMSQATLTQNGTSGQSAAGTRSTGGTFALYSGFWTPDDLVPTAASAIVAGRVMTASGKGIKNVKVSLAFPNGEIRTSSTGSFGYYSFAEIPVGGFYVISVAARKYVFSQPTQVREVLDDVRDVDFIAEQRNELSPEELQK